MKVIYLYAQNKLFVSDYQPRTIKVAEVFVNAMVKVFGFDYSHLDREEYQRRYDATTKEIKNRLLIGKGADIIDDGITTTLYTIGAKMTRKCEDFHYIKL